MIIKTVVWIPFNFCDLQRQDRPGFRYADTLAKPEWWKARAAVAEKFTLASLKNQTSKDFAVWGVGRKEDAGRALPMVKAFEQAGFNWVTDLRSDEERGPTELRLEPCLDLITLFKGQCDRLLLIRLDSDDMFSSRAVHVFQRAAARVLPGSALCLDDGYLLDARTMKIFNWHTGGNPPPFFGAVYDQPALQSVEAWYAYRKEMRLECFHHQLMKAKHPYRLGMGLYCVVVHGHNTTDDWSNSSFQKHVGTEIKGEFRKREILNDCGVRL